MVSSSAAQHDIVCKQHTPGGLLFDAPSHHIQDHVEQVGAQWGSLMKSDSNSYLACQSYAGLNMWTLREQTKQFINEFTSLVQDLDNTNLNIVLAGDYNLNLLK